MRRRSSPHTPYRLSMALQEKYKTEPELFTGHQGKVDPDILKGDYHIRCVPEKQDFSCSSPWLVPNISSPFLVAANALTWVLWSLYFWYEINTVRHMQQIAGNSLWRLWISVAGELGVLIPDSFVSFEVILPFFFEEKQRIHRYRLLGDAAPSIDIAIPCCGEDPSIVMDTVIAAASQDYPTDRFRVFVLDDKKDANLERLVREFQLERKVRPLITYVARPKPPGIRHYYKGGNVHYGYQVSNDLDQGSEYFAALDADMITEPDWLRRVVPHLILHDDSALACPPQHFYNIPDDDPLAQDSFVFARLLEPLRNNLGGASCTGSGYILRRSALEDIGGLPLVDVGEDIMLSYLLHGAGWAVSYVKEEIQLGLAPETYEAYIKQRMRWTDGSMLVTRFFSCFLPWSQPARKMSIGQRSTAILHTVSKFATVTLTLSLLLLPLGVWPTKSDDYGRLVPQADIRTLRMLFFTAYAFNKFNKYLLYGRVGTKNASYATRNRTWSAPYIAYRTIISSCPGLSHFHFESSGSIITKANERSATRRQPLPGRMLSVDMILHLLYVLIAAMPILLRTSRFSFSQNRNAPFFPLTGALLKLIQCIYHASIPVYYMLLPPTVPERAELLVKGPDGVNRPKTKVGQGLRPDNRFKWNDVLDLLVIYFCDWH